jgi:hypothetical protein
MVHGGNVRRDAGSEDRSEAGYQILLFIQCTAMNICSGEARSLNACKNAHDCAALNGAHDIQSMDINISISVYLDASAIRNQNRLWEIYSWNMIISNALLEVRMMYLGKSGFRLS